MYRKILVTLENGSADPRLIAHITELASRMNSELLLLHVADGFAARNFSRLKLAESEEMKADRDYLERVAEKMREHGLEVSAHLALGNPPQEILKMAKSKNCDLIAMGSHGHRLIGDLIHGSTIHEVRHRTDIPVLLLRSEKK